MSVLNCFSHVQLFVTLWNIACQAPLSMGFFRQEYWSGLPFPPTGDLPQPGIEPEPLMSPVLAGRFFTTIDHEHLNIQIGTVACAQNARQFVRPSAVLSVY